MSLSLSGDRGQLELDLVPGRRAGSFALGAPVGHIINLVRGHPDLVPRVELKYGEEDPWSTNLVLGLGHSPSSGGWVVASAGREVPTLSPPPESDTKLGDTRDKVEPVTVVLPDGNSPTDESVKTSGTIPTLQTEGVTSNKGESRPTTARLPGNGVSLMFEPTSQRLRLIVVHDLAKVRLLYRDMECQSSKTVATALLINQVFGPTHPGIFNATTGVFTLSYPGISFEFYIPERHRTLFAKPEDRLPLEFPDGTTPQCTCIYVYPTGTDWRQAMLPSLGTYAGVHCSLTGQSQATFLNRLSVRLGQDTVATFTDYKRAPTGEPTVRTRQVIIRFHQTTAQDLIADLGQPTTVFYKAGGDSHPTATCSSSRGAPPNTTTLHPGERPPSPTRGSAAQTEANGSTLRDYFYNYYEYGLDVLIDGQTHRCRKLVLHSNVPGHYDFGRYTKCPFVLFQGETPSPLDDSTEGGSGLDACVRWDAVREFFDREADEPLVFNRGSSEQNPFGSTLFYGYPGVIFEVMKNGCIPTVTLYP